MKEAAVSVRRLRKSFGSQVVLDEVNFEAPAGQTVALLGRNGAGKTTMIRTLLGLIAADQGEVTVAGCNPATEPQELRRRVGYLAEDQMMYGWMTAVELCRFLAPFYPKWDSRLADRYLERFDIPRHCCIDRLSKGQTVKLGLAVALAHSPAVAILDDPALGLDSISRKEFNRSLVEHLQAEGRTVIYSSHLLDEVEAVADQVAILDRGRIVRQGAADVLRDEIQRLVLPLEIARQMPAPQGLLDVHRRERMVEVVVDGCAQFLQQLASIDVNLSPSGMTLDEIFEAVVIGRPQDWAEITAVAAV
jgi:ABC-2 type transport system ATP-binding protein